MLKMSRTVTAKLVECIFMAKATVVGLVVEKYAKVITERCLYIIAVSRHKKIYVMSVYCGIKTPNSIAVTCA